MRNFLLAAAMAVALPAVPARAAELPQGLYDCTMGSMHLGEMRIGNGTYTEPALGGGGSEQFPFELTEAGTINWHGPMGGMSTGGNSVISTELKDDGGNAAYDVLIQLENGHTHTVSCSKE